MKINATTIFVTILFIALGVFAIATTNYMNSVNSISKGLPQVYNYGK